MKKRYKAPVALPFNMLPTQMMALSTNETQLGSGNIGTGSDQYTIGVKEEDEESSSIWDLYN